MSGEYQYTVDGEKVTFNEICARCVGVTRTTLHARIRLGWRTWKDLMRPPTGEKLKVSKKTRYFMRRGFLW